MGVLNDHARLGRGHGGTMCSASAALFFGVVMLLLSGEARGVAPTLTAATVEHAGSEGDFTSVTMTDDGTGGDTTASDGVFGARVPIYADDLPRYRFTYTLVVATEEEEEADVGTTPNTLFINELMASNSTTILDPQGDDDDWIELVNTGSEAIDLGGMYLSDKTSNPLKWQFPAGTTIAAGGYLLVWADDDEGDSPGLHTNFKLSAGGESVVLSDIDGRGNVVIDSVDFPAQTPDVSYGRAPEGTGPFQALAVASPGAPTPTVPEIAVIADGPATEGGTATLTLTATPAPTADLAVNVAVTQGEGDDYLPTTLPTSVSIAAGASEATLAVALPNDTVDEPNGVLTVTVGSGTGYTVSATAGSASLTLRDDDASPAASTVVINELMASNSTILDPQGDDDDWIELRNNGDETLDLSDMYLSDDRANPKKWQFPTGATIAAGGYLLVWADDDDGDSPGLHTNFKLSAKGETVVLSDTDGNGNAVIDAVDFGPLGEDEAWGRMPNGNGAFRTLPATPGAANPLISTQPPLTAEFIGMPAKHDGRSLFRFELRFSEDFPGRLSYRLLRDTAFRVTNGRVRGASRVEPGQNRRWTITVRPDSYKDVTVELPATTDCAAAGAVCTQGGRPLSNSLAATVESLPPLTAEFIGMPAEHDGRSLFRFELRFSEDFPGKAGLPAVLRDVAFRVTSGAVRQAVRVEPGQNRRWTIGVQPDSYGDVTVELPATTDCAAAGAVCAEDGRPLSNSLAAMVESLPPLTAEFIGMPAEHDGRSLFRFELRFSEDFPGRLSYRLLRDTAFRVTNGRVRGAGRVEPGQNRRWTITVRPDTYGDVTVELPATTDCAAAGAVCAEDGRPLSNNLAATVAGPPPLTAEFIGMPAEHDGRSLFRFELRFSEDFPGRLSYRRLRDGAFRVTNGAVREASRAEPGQNRRWTIGVQPDSYGDVTVELPATTDCAAAGAICTERGRPLSNSLAATVTGADADGEVALSTYEPKVGQALDASVSDPDGVVGGSLSWQWEYDDGQWVDDGSGRFVPVWRTVSGATTTTLTPSEDMLGYELRAVASYGDGQSGPGERDKRAVSAATDEVELPNASAQSVELLQGPLVARFGRDDAVAQPAALVAGRRTAVAMEVRHDVGSAPPAVLLRVATDTETVEVEPVRHPAPGVDGRPAVADGETPLHSVFVASVPGRLVGAETTFSVLVDLDDALAEDDETDNVMVAPVAGLRVVDAPAFKVRVVPLLGQDGRPPRSTDLEPLLATTLALLPIGTHRLDSAPPLAIGEAAPREMLDRLHAAWNRDADPDEFYHGLYRESEHRLEGLALVGGRVSVSPVPQDASSHEASRIVAHAIAHNFGLEETPAPPATAYGWSSASQRFFSPVDQEIMAPMEGTTLFISRENYERAMRWMGGSMRAAGPPSAGEAAGGVRSIALTGGVDASGAWYLYRAEHSPKPPRVVSAGPHTAVLFNRGGIPLMRQPLRTLPLSVGRGGAWALRVPYTRQPLTLRIWSEDGGLLLDADLDL